MRMNKKFFFILVLTLILGVLLAGCSDTKTPDKEDENGGQAVKKSEEKVIEMNLNSIFASTHHVSVNAYDPWAKLVEEKTNGRIKVNVYYGGTLGASTSVWQDVQGRIYDVGGPAVVPYSHDTELYPLTIAGLPFAFPDVQSAINVLTKFSEKYGAEANEKVILMGMSPSDPYDLISIKPIRKIEDIKGIKIRVTGKSDADLIKAWGAIPVSVPYEETYGSLDKKTLDASIAGIVATVGSSYYEVAPYLTRISEAVQLLIPVMSRDFYDELPEDLKELFDKELSPELGRLMSESYLNQTVDKLPELEKLIEGKGEVIDLEPEELQKFKDPAKEQWEAWVEEANGKGYPGEEMMDYFKELLEEEGIPLPF